MKKARLLICLFLAVCLLTACVDPVESPESPVQGEPNHESAPQNQDTEPEMLPGETEAPETETTQREMTEEEYEQQRKEANMTDLL